MIICYICRADISKAGYQHFCQTAHCTHASCHKCRLFTDTLEDDRAAMKEAGLQTLQMEQQKQAAEAGVGAANGSKTTTDKVATAMYVHLYICVCTCIYVCMCECECVNVRMLSPLSLLP